MISIAAIAKVRSPRAVGLFRKDLYQLFRQNVHVDNTTINFVGGTQFQHDSDQTRL
jgi:hypothetical protein